MAMFPIKVEAHYSKENEGKIAERLQGSSSSFSAVSKTAWNSHGSNLNKYIKFKRNAHATELFFIIAMTVSITAFLILQLFACSATLIPILSYLAITGSNIGFVTGIAASSLSLLTYYYKRKIRDFRKTEDYTQGIDLYNQIMPPDVKPVERQAVSQ